LREEGLQVPIVLRKLAEGQGKYQLVSGFRRLTAAKGIGWTEIPAIIRDLDDDGCFKAAVLENSARKTYSDIDRAHVILAHRKRGVSGVDAARLMGLTDRQARNLASLLELPESVQAAIDDPEQRFSGTHGLTLKKLAGRYTDLGFDRWVARVNEEDLSVAQLVRAVNKEHGKKAAPGFVSIFNQAETKWDSGVVRFAPVKVDLGALSSEEMGALRRDLQRVLERLG